MLTRRTSTGSAALLLTLYLTACSSDTTAPVDTAPRVDAGFDQTAPDAAPVDSAPGDGDCSALPAKTTPDIRYHTIAGVAPELLSLDVSAPARASCDRLPVVVWVHGGGWAIGDKSNQMTHKLALFNGAGYVVVSVNYRLSPSPASTDSQRVKHPAHAEDVARALSWIADNVEGYGGDPGRIAVLGHSAGAHLIALVATDEGYLQAHEKQLSLVRCVGSFDTEGYDIPTHLAGAGPQTTEVYQNAFGSDPAAWPDASPVTHVAAGKAIAPFLIASRGTAKRRAIAQSFADKLTKAGIAATIIDAGALTHAEVNSRIGEPGDTIMTPPITAFLDDCFAP